MNRLLTLVALVALLTAAGIALADDRGEQDGRNFNAILRPARRSA